MAKYSAQLVAKSNENKNVTTTLSNVNPETAPVKIKQFAQTLNALTTNTYNETNYIVTTNLDTETPPVPAQTPTLTLSRVPTLAEVQQGGGSGIPVTYNGDGHIYCYRRTGCANCTLLIVTTQENTINFGFGVGGSGTTGGTYVIGATGTANYSSVEVEYTLE